MKFAPGKVRMKLDGTEREDSALISGPFAIHQTRRLDWSKARGAWTITHLPSGLALFQNARSERAARAFCRDVERLADWSSNPPVLPEQGTDAWCAISVARSMATPW